MVTSASSCFISPPFPCGRRVVCVGFIRDLASIFYRIIIVFDLSPLKLIILLGFAFLVICVVIMVSGRFPLGAFVLAALKRLDATINGSPQALNVIRCRLQTNKQTNKLNINSGGILLANGGKVKVLPFAQSKNHVTNFTEGNSIYSYFKKCCRGERRMSIVERQLHD